MIVLTLDSNLAWKGIDGTIVIYATQGETENFLSGHNLYAQMVHVSRNRVQSVDAKLTVYPHAARISL